VFYLPLPDRSKLSEFYPEDYWWSAEGQARGRLGRLMSRLEELYREFVVADHVRFLAFCAHKFAAGGKLLLDIGCGSGVFLHVARKHGFLAHGMDASAHAVEIAQRQYGLSVRKGEIGSLVWEPYRFDLVTMFHVLEHLPDPRVGLRFAGRLLRPTGALVIQVPNLKSIQARLFAGYWYGLDVPRHVINFTPKGLALLLNEEGFEFDIIYRFSLRDNPASFASSLVPWLDPIRRRGRNLQKNPLLSAFKSAGYLGVFLLSLPPALIESALGAGGTLWAVARPRRQTG